MAVVGQQVDAHKSTLPIADEAPLLDVAAASLAENEKEDALVEEFRATYR